MNFYQIFPQMTDFVLQIADWYRLNARELPWRTTKDPYFIWLSEIILQQTRVEQGKSYYLRFTDTFPTVSDLANADEQEVLKLWQGLGYYSRARNLHATAKAVHDEFDGRFPADYTQLLSLKGIGPYTAAAIASFAFDLPHAVVDGNVYRVLSRYFGIDTAIDSTIGKKEFQGLADSLIPSADPALFNQSVMEFGAMLCTPAKPDCGTCPVASSCASMKNERWRERPVKEKKTKVRDRYFHYFHVESNDRISVLKREQKDVWQQLYEFPMIETSSNDLTLEEAAVQGFDINTVTRISESKHVLSHQRIHATFYKVHQPEKELLDRYPSVKLADFAELPIHRLMDRYVEKFL